MSKDRHKLTKHRRASLRRADKKRRAYLWGPYAPHLLKTPPKGDIVISMIADYPESKHTTRTCARCFHVGDGFDFVLLNWKTNGGKEKQGLVHQVCFDKAKDIEKLKAGAVVMYG